MPVRKSVRLPKHVQPVRYRLMLRPNLENFTFYGEETAYLEITKTTKEIVFHAKDLKVLSAELTQDDQIIPAKVKHNSKVETVTFTFSKTIKKGAVELKLIFEGELNDNLRGFYRSKYLHLNQEKYLATTQFESTDARRAFPCIDEPSAKAIFDVTLMIPKGMTAISNTVSTNISEHDSGYQIVEFAPTPKMSTYLLAFLVGDFEFIEGQTEEGVVVRIFTTPGKKKQAEFALDVACKMITFYNRYFDIPYPLPVMDMIAVPDFAAGAMENWGAVTYRETALLIDPKNSSAANRQRVAIVIAHELAHMWFGDLVTMEWWTHLWLNEGFASYIEYLATDHVFPEWDIWTQFVYADQSVALKLDGLKNTHPIEVEVNHPSEISEIFDKVSYSKGASIIRMLADYLGPEMFRDGLRHYLKKHQYSNARTEDLWAAFAKISGKPVAKIMKNWTALPGYPLIQVEETNKKLKLSQRRFFSNPASQTTKKSLWSVPINIKSSTDQTKKVLLKTPKTEVPRPAGEWFKVNPSEYGFYRVLYTPDQLQNLTQAINDQQLSAIDRFGIVRDCFDLSEAGYLETVQALKLAESYVTETDFTVWAELTAHLSQLDDLFYGQSYYDQYQKFARQIYSQIAPLMSWTKKPKESHTSSLLRNLALYKFGAYGDKETIKQAQILFKEFVDQAKPVDADIRGAVYNLVAINGGSKEYKIFKQKYIAETLQQERDRLARAMTLFDDPKLIQQTLEFAISKDVRAQDAIFIIKAIFINPAGKDLAWQFIKDNWTLFKERYGGGLMMLPRLLESLEVFNTKPALADIEKFFAKNPAPEAARTLAQAIEQINSNISWLKRDSKAIAKFLQTV